MLSVQGALFILPKKTILSHDWILSKILTSEIPWKGSSDDGQYYIDVDPTSFRLILSILNGTVSLSLDANKLSTVDLALVKATARYLMLDSIVHDIEGIKDGFERLLDEKETRIYNLENELAKYDGIEDAIKNVNVQVKNCRSYRTFRSQNECGCLSIIIGPLDINPEENKEVVSCMECGNDRSRIYGRNSSQFTDRTVQDVEDFSNVLIEMKTIL